MNEESKPALGRSAKIRKKIVTLILSRDSFELHVFRIQQCNTEVG
jgi:hypothetical protein